jgi:hypothetical protein
LEGIPHHAWFKVVEKVLSDEALIHHVQEATRRRSDLRAFRCWAFCKDPSRIPQTVFLTLTSNDPAIGQAQVHFVRPREMKGGHVFKVLIHLDVVEDLSFYQYPCEDLLADGKTPWREFSWQYGQPDREVDDDDSQPPTRYCAPPAEPRWHNRDDEEDRERNHCRSGGFLRKVSHWMDNRGRRANRPTDRYRGEGRRHHTYGRNASPPPSRERLSPKERRSLRCLWQEKGSNNSEHAEHWIADPMKLEPLPAEVIEIVPQ